jgi:pentapeptide MXKDX repeat protein
MAKKKAAWTVIVYLAGDNNLSTECMFALTEMKRVGLGKRVNVIAQFDPNDPYLPTHRYEINRNGKSKGLHSDIIDRAAFDETTEEVCFNKESSKAKALAAVRSAGKKIRNVTVDEAGLIGSVKDEEVISDDTDTGSPVTLYNFISFCLEKYPAEHYMVVLSGHGGGTEADYLLKDESTAGSLTFNELKQVFRRVKEDRQGKLIDILGMDNCLMSMAEICYELRESAQVVVACESFSPASGWPYREILNRLRDDFGSAKVSKGQSVVAEAARAIVEEYVNYYSNYWIAGLSVTQSALALSKVEKLKQHIDKLAAVMEEALVAEREDEVDGPTSGKNQFQDELLLAHWEAQSFNGEQFVDLYDFCECLENRVASKAIATQCGELKKFLTSEFVLKSCYCGADYQYSYGVSLYFPWSQVAPAYWNLDFADNGNCGWGRFLKTYTLLTRREPRGVKRETRLSSALGATINATLGTVRMSTDRMSTDRMSTDRMSTDRMSTDRMSTDRMSTDRMSTDRMSTGTMKNRVHSMRNPPTVFFPDKCVKNRRSSLAAQEILRVVSN